MIQVSRFQGEAIVDVLRAEVHQAVLEMRRMGTLIDQERRHTAENFASLEAEIHGLKAESTS